MMDIHIKIIGQFINKNSRLIKIQLKFKETVNQKRFTVFFLLKIKKKGKQKMKNIDEKILMAEEEIKQLQNKRKKLISQQKQEERKKRDRHFYEKGGVFESIFTERKELTKDEFYQLITFPNIKEADNQKILKIIEQREQMEVENTGKEDEEMDIKEQSLVYKGAHIHLKAKEFEKSGDTGM